MPDTLSDASATPAAGGALAPEAAPALPSPLADISSGQVAAVSLPPITGGKTTPLDEFILSNFESLHVRGVDYYESSDGQHSVFFNPKMIKEPELEAADKAGTLFEIAPLLDPSQPQGAAPEAPQGAAPAPAAPRGALSGATVAPDSALKSARLSNSAPAPQNAPNSVPGQLGRRAI